MERRATVASAEGLHARPAALFVKAAAEQPVKVLIAKDGGEAVAADSILGVMTLGAKCGDDVILSAEDSPVTASALDALVTLIQTP